MEGPCRELPAHKDAIAPSTRTASIAQGLVGEALQHGIAPRLELVTGFPEQASRWTLTKIASQGASSPGSVSRIESIERIDLTGSGDNTLSFGVEDVQDIVGMNWINSRTQDALGWANGTFAFPSTVRGHQLVVDGDAGDVVNLPSTPSSWVNAGTVFLDGIGSRSMTRADSALATSTCPMGRILPTATREPPSLRIHRVGINIPIY